MREGEGELQRRRLGGSPAQIPPSPNPPSSFFLLSQPPFAQTWLSTASRDSSDQERAQGDQRTTSTPSPRAPKLTPLPFQMYSSFYGTPGHASGSGSGSNNQNNNNSLANSALGPNNSNASTGNASHGPFRNHEGGIPVYPGAHPQDAHLGQQLQQIQQQQIQQQIQPEKNEEEEEEQTVVTKVLSQSSPRPSREQH